MDWLERSTVVTPYLILCGSEEEYLRVMKRLKCKYFDSWLKPSFGGRTHSFSDGEHVTCVVCIDIKAAKQMDQIVVIGMLVHEAVHVWQELCSDIGEKNPSREFEAYSIQIIAQRLVRSYKKKRDAL